LLQSLLRNFSKTYQNLFFLQDLFEFLSLQPLIRSKGTECRVQNLNLIKGICFEQVSFYYPGSQRLALDGFTLTIPVGQIVAIVGKNGAGKSTLVKLLCRFSAILILKKNQRKFCYLNRELVSKHHFLTDNYHPTLEIRNLSMKNRSQLINPDVILTKCLVF